MSFEERSTDTARPTQKRISTLGLRAPMAGRETIGGCPGPMAVDRDALEIFMKVALSAKPWRIDPALTAKEWTPYAFTARPKIAIQWWDGVVKPHPPMLRALREVAESCRQAGMEVVDWDCEHLDHQKGWNIVSSLYWPDGAKEVLDLIGQSGEPVLPLTKWIAQEQPSVKELSQHELWKVS
jgi:amidase